MLRVTNKGFPRDFLLFIILLIVSGGCGTDVNKSPFSPEIDAADLRSHIEFLASDEMKGRLAGSREEAISAAYIAEKFEEFGLIPAAKDGRYYQAFALLGPMVQAMKMENYTSRNVIGYVRGSEEPQQWIIIGAHYDGQGMGGFISMDSGTEPEIHNSADDNASGTAGLLELAHYFSEYPAKKSILFIAFSGEELGLLGSRYFIDNPVIDLHTVDAMINLDMIGRLNDNTLTILGTGSSGIWNDLIEKSDDDTLQIRTPGTGTGASDHAPFYEAGIPVLHYFTGTHENYHRASDTADKINYQGTERVVRHVRTLVRNLAEKDSDLITFSTN